MPENHAPCIPPAVQEPLTPLDRVFAAADCQTQVALGKLLGIQQSSISDAKRRGVVPAEWLIKLLRLKGINPEWIISGADPKYLGPATGVALPAPVVYLTRARPPQDCSTQELTTELVRRALADMQAG